MVKLKLISGKDSYTAFFNLEAFLADSPQILHVQLITETSRVLGSSAWGMPNEVEHLLAMVYTEKEGFIHAAPPVHDDYYAPVRLPGMSLPPAPEPTQAAAPVATDEDEDVVKKFSKVTKPVKIGLTLSK